MTKKTALLSCETYDKNTVYETLKKLFELAPPPDVTEKTVLIKPNILIAKKPEAAVCTHPAVVGAAVRLFKERGAKRVLAGESPATMNSTAAAKSCGIYDAVIEAGGEWIEFAHGIQVPCPEGKRVKTLTFASAFAEAEVVVSAAKLKTHQLMGYTGAMKNMFGLMVGLDKAQSHFRFPERPDFSAFLTDVCVAAKTAYGIMDAITAMEGPGGPGNGDPVQVNMLAASADILALDWACSSLVGYNPHAISNLQDALERGIWLKKPEDIEYCGIPPEQLKPKHFKIVRQFRGTSLLKPYMPHFIHQFATFYFTRYPFFKNSLCIRCGKCIEICPAKTLFFKDTKKTRKVVLKAENCLHCYCCHETCPVNAIRLKRKWVWTQATAKPGD